MVINHSLESSINDINEALTLAQEEDRPIPPQHIVVKALDILTNLHQKTSRDYFVYLMHDGAIAIDTRGPKPDGDFIALNINGSVCCSGEKGGQHWHLDYLNSNQLYESILIEKLNELGEN